MNKYKQLDLLFFCLFVCSIMYLKINIYVSIHVCKCNCTSINTLIDLTTDSQDYISQTI